jgi:hypothetical protein
VTCDVLCREISRSGAFILAEGVSPDEAARIIAAQPSTPGFVTWRVDRV